MTLTDSTDSCKRRKSLLKSDCKDSSSSALSTWKVNVFFLNLKGVVIIKRYRNSDSVPLSSCDRGIGDYVRSVEKGDISSEVERILARASTFSFSRNISTWTV